MRTPVGLCAQKVLAYIVDLRRIHSTVARVTRGLHFHETGGRLLPSHTVTVSSDYSIADEALDIRRKLDREIVVPLARKPARVIGNGAFWYRYERVTKGQVTLSVWALTFYAGMSFLAITGPEDRIAGV
jgi:hypothetical protein